MDNVRGRSRDRPFPLPHLSQLNLRNPQSHLHLGRSEHGRSRARVTLPSPVAPPQLSDLPRPHVCDVRVWQPDPVGRMTALFGYEMVT